MTNTNDFDRLRWTNERLDRLATDVEGNTSGISELRSTAESLLQIAQIHQQDIEILSRDMQGLRLEVRRLVEELRERRNGN